MNKGPSTSAAKTPSALPQKSAWAKGPPQSASSASSPRSQSPAPTASQPQSQSHSRRPSQLGGSTFKDAVGVGIASGSRGNMPPKTTNPISFGTVNGSPSDKPAAPSSPPAPAPPIAKSESRPVQSFGSIEATQSNSMATTGKPSVTASSSNPPATSTSSASSTTTSSTPATAPHKQKVDVSSFFRGGGSDTKTSSPVTTSFPESVASPPTRSNTLSPAVPSLQNQNAPGGPAGPGPHPHAHPHQPPQPYPPPFIPVSMRNPSVGNGPRSPSFQRAVPNGAAGRPPVNAGPPGPNGNNMPSPRLAPPQPHVQHQHQHQQQPLPVQGIPQMQMSGWPGYYYPYAPGMPMQPVPGTEHYMQYPPQHWHMHPPPHQPQGPPGANGPPQTPLAHTHGLPVQSPRPSQPPLQAPGTPPAGISSPLPSAGPRLNSNASAFVPSHAPQQQRQNRIKITDASGHEVDLTGLRKQGATPTSTSSTPASDKNGRRAAPIRLETEEARLKRLAEEERQQKEKREEERKKQEEKDSEERKRREEAEKKANAEKEARLKAEEVERKRKEEEERRQKEEEQERVRKEEEVRKRKEEEERERLRKEEEEKERVRREAEERIRREEEERRRKEEEEERRRKEEEEERHRKEEEERQRKETEEKDRVRKEEEVKVKAELEAIAQADAKKTQPTAMDIKSKKEGEAATTVTDAPLSTSPETGKRRPIPGPLDLSSTHKPSVPQPLPSALATARHIQDVYQVQYPEGIKSPKPELNTNAKDGKFRYDREFLLQFMSVCKEKPDNLPSLEAIGLEPVDQTHSMGRGGSGRRGVSGGMGPPSSTARQGSIGLGFNALNGKVGSGFAMGMGNFAAPKLTSEERFMRSTSMSGGGPGGLAFGGGRPSPMVRSSSQGGPGASGSKRTRSKRGDATRNETNRINAATTQYNMNATTSLEPVAPLEHSANRWVPGTTRRAQTIDQDTPEIVEKKVRALLNKLTMEKFESISNQIIAWANKSENEKDGRTLIQVIRLVFEKATDEAAWSEMYARLCRKMMEQISPNVQDEGIRNAEGKPITGGLLFRKYLLNRCQEDFERGWSNKETTAAAALIKANEDRAVKNANEKNKEEGEEVMLYSEEYYAAQKAKRQGLGLIKFIGELFKLQMLTERIMHECIKKLLSNVDNPEEEEIESLCKLLTTVGQALDTSKARGHMDVYFSRMKELAKSNNVANRMQFMLQDVIDLRERKWIPRNAAAAPTTLAQIHESAAKEKAQQEQHNMARAAMSRGGSRRGHDREGGAQVGPDGWAITPGPSRPANKAGDLTNFGKIQKGSGAMNFGPASVFTVKKGDNKRDSASLSRVSSNTNMFQMLESASNEPAAAVPTPTRASRPASRTASRTASVDLTHNAPNDSIQPTQRPKLNLLPRTKPLEKSEDSPARSHAEDEGEEGEEGEIVEKDSNKVSMSKEQAENKIDQDRKEFFAIRDLNEGEEYFAALPSEHRHILVQKLVMHALEAKEADANLVADLFERAISRNLCSPASFEEGFLPVAEALDDIAIDAPKAPNLMAIMMKGAKLDEERRTRIASKSTDSEKLLALSA